MDLRRHENCTCIEVTTRHLWGKHGIEIRIWSLSQDNSHSWVRISYGTNKHVVDSKYNNTGVPADLPEEQASQSSVKVTMVAKIISVLTRYRPIVLELI